MERFKLLITLFGLTLLPIINNVILLLYYPFLIIQSLFSIDADFYDDIKKFKDGLAKLR